MDGGVVDTDAALGEHRIEVSVAHAMAAVPENSLEDHLTPEVPTLEVVRHRQFPAAPPLLAGIGQVRNGTPRRARREVGARRALSVPSASRHGRGRGGAKPRAAYLPTTTLTFVQLPLLGTER